MICPFFGLAHLPAGTAWRNVFTGVAAHLKPGGMAAFHLPLAEKLAQPAPPPDRPVLQHRLDATGRQLSIFIKSRTSKPAVGRIERQARERLTYYAADPTPFALEAGLTLDRPPIDLGGVGAVHVFRRD